MWEPPYRKTFHHELGFEVATDRISTCYVVVIAQTRLSRKERSVGTVRNRPFRVVLLRLEAEEHCFNALLLFKLLEILTSMMSTEFSVSRKCTFIRVPQAFLYSYPCIFYKSKLLISPITINFSKQSL